MLATAVCAVMAGACTFAAMADWVRDLDPPGWVKLGFTDHVPVPTTLWRLLTRIDDTALAAVLTRWVRSRAVPTGWRNDPALEPIFNVATRFELKPCHPSLIVSSRESCG
jgi:hypothetical protein